MFSEIIDIISEKNQQFIIFSFSNNEIILLLIEC